MTTVDEQNVAATIVMLKAAAYGHGHMPTLVKLVEHDPPLAHAQWDKLAREFLDKRERAKQEKGTLRVR